MVVNVNGGVQMEPAGIVGRVGNQFPLTVPLDTNASTGRTTPPPPSPLRRALTSRYSRDQV